MNHPNNRIPTLIALLALILSGTLTTTAAPAPAYDFADPAFLKLWTRTDSLVAQGRIARSYFWGPQPNSGSLSEPYAEGQGAMHKVQYFDKSRMEINNPTADPNSQFYVTNGLLTVELISGRMQIGNNQFTDRWPAEIDIASDPDDANAPTYASFRGAVLQTEADKRGQAVYSLIYRTGLIDTVHGGEGYMGLDKKYNVKYAYYEAATQHNIPDVFWQFLNQSAPIIENGRQLNARLFNPYFYATGYPISDAYWSSVKIAGQTSVDVLIQPYERRVLTYVPSAPAGFKVQMGNIGQHYYQWRYNDAGKSQALLNQCGNSPQRGFGTIWASSDKPRINLGCPYDPTEFRTTMRSQTFQNGKMLAYANYDNYSGTRYEIVFALYNDGTAQTFDNLSQTGTQPPADNNPPAGLYAPTGNLGAVWKNNQPVRTRLGWATAPEDSQIKDEAGNGGGVYQRFSGGIMLYPNLTNKQIYLLYHTSGNALVSTSVHRTELRADRWQLYPDTYNP